MLSKITGIIIIFFLLSTGAHAAVPDEKAAADISYLINILKEDPRGPFETILWYCPDGTTVPPPEMCPEKGGYQRAAYKGKIIRLQDNYGIYPGQILSGTKNEDFFDVSRNHSRLNQYIIEQYLKAIDDGWILRKGRFYRGAYQSEDEENWGKNFLLWLLSQKDYINGKFFLCREAVRSVPHRDENTNLEMIRVLSKEISDAFPPFTDLRSKIHGHPDPGDYDRVSEFYDTNLTEIPEELKPKFDELEQRLLYAFSEASFAKLNNYFKKLPETSPVNVKLKQMLNTYSAVSAKEICINIVDIIISIRQEILTSGSPDETLSLFDLSLDLEMILFKTYPRWKDDTLREVLIRCNVLALAAAGCGFIELNEWGLIASSLEFNNTGNLLNFDKFSRQAETYRRLVEWSAGMVRAQYMETVALFQAFEPLTAGFIDDRIRSSIVLHLGHTAGLLADFYSRRAEIKNNIFGLAAQNQVRGLNPGFARGRLNIIAGNFYNINFKKDEIYVLMSPPSNLKPVAGIATVSEGNAVSHVQLLARNLGIPNAVLSQDLLNDLRQYYGTDVFYAVSPGGTVIIKKAEDMDQREKDLFTHQKELNGRAAISTKKLDLQTNSLLSLKKIRARHSGQICGPKAANLGELRYLFPDRVAPGFIIPFGIFSAHMRRKMPDSDISYMDYIIQTFTINTNGEEPAEESEKRILSRLSDLRESIKKMPLSPSFIVDFRAAFNDIFDGPVGMVPVFIRSDTNVEDLKDFTGAGLNLTVPNVAAEKDIFQAIRDVWASPYTERSYMWRQRFLLNPEQVYPSILILRSINCDKSGVVITTGLDTNNSENITASFSRGVGGAVEGQSAETYEVFQNGSYLFLSPSREPEYKLLPRSGGTRTAYTAFSRTILNKVELAEILDVSSKIRGRLPLIPEIGSAGPYDIEMGFLNHKLWLFQARPFVENRAAKSSAYLRSLDPVIPDGLWIKLDEKIR